MENHASCCGVRFRFALWFRPKRENCFLKLRKRVGRFGYELVKVWGKDLVYFKEWTCKEGWGELAMGRHLQIPAIRWPKHNMFLSLFMPSDIDRCIPMMRIISCWFVYRLFVRNLFHTFIVWIKVLMFQINPVLWYKTVTFRLLNISWIGCDNPCIMWVLDGPKSYQALR